MNAYLFAAYTLVWTLLFCYLFYLHRQQRRMGEKLRSIVDEMVRKD